MSKRLWALASVSCAAALVACGANGRGSSSAGAGEIGPTASTKPIPTASRTHTTSLATTRPKATAAAVTAADSAAPASPTTRSTSLGSAPTVQVSPAPVAEGTYRYNQTGTSSTGAPPATSATLVVDPPRPDGTQTQHLKSAPQAPTDDTTFLFDREGMFITVVVQHAQVANQTMTWTCRFTPPVPAPSWPPAAGRRFAGSADCGSITVSVTGVIGATRSATLDGHSRTVDIVTTTLVTHGQVESTSVDTDWFDPTLRLAVHSESRTQGKYGFASFSSDVIRDLVSGIPG